MFPITTFANGLKIVCRLGTEKLRRVAKLARGLGKIPYYIVACLLYGIPSLLQLERFRPILYKCKLVVGFLRPGHIYVPLFLGICAIYR